MIGRHTYHLLKTKTSNRRSQPRRNPRQQHPSLHRRVSARQFEKKWEIDDGPGGEGEEEELGNEGRRMGEWENWRGFHRRRITQGLYTLRPETVTSQPNGEERSKKRLVFPPADLPSS